MKKKMKILITSGPTRGPIDAMRYITNKSSGRLGTEIAIEALKQDADVTFIYGKGSITPDIKDIGEQLYSNLKFIEVETVDDLIKSINQELNKENYYAVIHSIAVLDYVPDKYIDDKVASGKDEWTIRLIKTPKAIKIVKEINPDVFLVGFKLEVGKTRKELVKIAYKTLLKSDADLIIANDLKDLERGEHIAYFVNPKGEIIDIQTGKKNIAKKLIELIVNRVRLRQGKIVRS
ncbi:MAG: hypothetical protein KAV97_01950 [Actinomycetia bacterium]|nr:hypothetical protein [Actinomycetes bacterium]